MVDINKKREKEKKTLRVMIGVYCRGKHKHKENSVRNVRNCWTMRCSNGKMSVHGDKDILQCLQSALLFKRDAGKDQRSYEVCRTENVVLSSASGAGSYVGDNERKNEKEIGEEK